jgi:hypothetical protein
MPSSNCRSSCGSRPTLCSRSCNPRRTWRRPRTTRRQAIKRHGKNSDQARAATREAGRRGDRPAGRGRRGRLRLRRQAEPGTAEHLKAGRPDQGSRSPFCRASSGRRRRTADNYDGNYNANTKAPGATAADKQLEERVVAGQGTIDGNYNAKLSPSPATSWGQVSARRSADPAGGSEEGHPGLSGSVGLPQERIRRGRLDRARLEVPAGRDRARRRVRHQQGLAAEDREPRPWSARLDELDRPGAGLRRRWPGVAVPGVRGDDEGSVEGGRSQRARRRRIDQCRRRLARRVDHASDRPGRGSRLMGRPTAHADHAGVRRQPAVDQPVGLQRYAR